MSSGSRSPCMSSGRPSLNGSAGRGPDLASLRQLVKPAAADGDAAELSPSQGAATQRGSVLTHRRLEPAQRTPESARAASGQGGPTGWMPIELQSALVREGLPPVVLQDRQVLEELSRTMSDKLNSMFAFMNQVVVWERARHSSNISLMMRKVDQDLKDTYDSVREIFGNLTKQLVSLVKEVENSRSQVKAIQEKYITARKAAEAQAQYVLELEAVLDGQKGGVADSLRKLQEQSTGRKQELAQQEQDHKLRMDRLKKENAELRQRLRRSDYADKQQSVEPPPLPEMSASWTRRAGQQDSTPSPQGFGGSDWDDQEDAANEPSVVESVLAYCDAGRAVSRSKPARMPPLSRGRAEQSPLKAREVQALRRRAEKAEERTARLHELVAFSAKSLSLLRDVFSELRSSKYIASRAPDGTVPLTEDHKLPAASTVLHRVVKLFHAHGQRLNGLHEVMAALSQEISAGAPPTKHQASGGMRQTAQW